MKASLLCTAVLLAACSKPAPDAQDSANAQVQAGVDSTTAHAENATHDAPGGLKPTPPIFERNQRDSLGRALPRPTTTTPASKKDSVEPPGPPQLKVDTLVRRRP